MQCSTKCAIFIDVYVRCCSVGWGRRVLLSLFFRAGLFRSEHCVFVLTEFITDNNVCSSLLYSNIVVHIKASGIPLHSLCFTLFLLSFHFAISYRQTWLALSVNERDWCFGWLFVCVRLRLNQFFLKRCSSLNEYLCGFCYVWIDTIFALLCFHGKYHFLAEDSDVPVR